MNNFDESNIKIANIGLEVLIKEPLYIFIV